MTTTPQPPPSAGYRKPRPRHAARLPVSAVRVDGQALAVAAAGAAAGLAVGSDRPRVRLRPHPRQRLRSHEAARRATRSASASSSTGRVLDANGRPVPNTLVEIWQANAAGRYPHRRDKHNAPIDPNFTGAGRTLTDERRPLPLRHHPPGRVSVAQPLQRLAARAHPLLAVRPRVRARGWSRRCTFPAIRCSTTTRCTRAFPTSARAAPGLGVRLGDDDPRAGARLPVRHRAARPRRDADGELLRRRRTTMSLQTTSSQTVGPYLHIGIDVARHRRPRPRPGVERRARSPIDGRVIDGDGAPVNDALVEIWQANAHGRYAHPDDTRRPAARAGASAASAACPPTTTAASASRRSSRAACRRRRQAAGAAPQRDDLHARHAEASRHAHLLPGRSRQRRRSGAADSCRRRGAPR